MMKKIKHILLTVPIAAAMLLSGCNGWLDETIYGTISDGTFWKNEQDVREGINSAYGRLSTAYNGFSTWQYVIEDGGADYYAGSSPYGEFTNYTGWSSTYPDAVDWGLYKFFWNQISYLNKTIDMVMGAEMSNEMKLYYTSEARALRAFLYFTLVQWFNDVPLVTSSDDERYSIPKTPASEIYGFIKTEYEESIPGLLNKEDYFATGTKEYTRLTKGAVMGLLARVHLVLKEYDQCKEVCRKLVEEQETYGTYSLMPNYKEMFKAENSVNTEFMWTLAGNGITQGSMFQVYLFKLWDVEEKPFERDASYDVYEKWNGSWSLSYDFYTSFDANDKRRNDCMLYNPDCDTEKVMVTKYPAKTTNKSFSATDFPMVRYADVLLMYAESCLLGTTPDVSKAVSLVNEVRGRTGAALYLPDDFNTPESFKMRIYDERRFELYFEGCAKRDMLRFGTLLDHIISKSKDAGANPERYYYLPFPASALTANSELVQNPGYTN